ncbi:hypothetical protein P5V15_003019 [Pogonomyrmex californicus]
MIDTVVHDYTLHIVYGWSIHLLGAIWDSITHLLLLLGTKKFQKPEQASAPESDLHSKTPENQVYPLLPPEEKSGFSFELKK